ncbi:MAG: hypothetical protein COB02_05565 [Candidatus Cloacimonadota bacterium]|nr:MAG: hypothetical protein COB02_05565 [Candidatus Cloacimonadota bacterium]
MLIRAISGFFIVAFILFSLKLGVIYFASFWLLIVTFAHYEAYTMSKFLILNRVYKFCSVFHLFTLLILLQKFPELKEVYDLDLLFLSPILFIMISIFLYRDDNKEVFFKEFTSGFLLFSYVVFFFSSMIIILVNVKNPVNFIFLLFCIMWLQDTFAYFGGRLFGRHKLNKSLSPKKTWEGSIIGILVMGVILFSVQNQFFSMFKANFLIFLLIVGIAGQIGDLLESCFKRCLGVKDSGWIIPGHGGVLDRFDSVTAGSLCALYFLLLF